MVWFIAVCAVAVLVAASFAAVGHFGELPDPVTDTYAPTLPAGPLSARELERVRFGRELRGYSPSAVRAFLADVAGERIDSPQQVSEARFPVVLGGLSMPQVDAALARLRSSEFGARPDPEPVVKEPDAYARFGAQRPQTGAEPAVETSARPVGGE